MIWMLMDSNGNALASVRGRRRARRHLLSAVMQGDPYAREYVAIGYDRKGKPRRTLIVDDVLGSRV